MRPLSTSPEPTSSPRVVLFGATGFTGRLTAESLLKWGVTPLLAARKQASLDDLVAELGKDLPTALADVEDPASIAALLSPGDVLITTVGPFTRWGRPAAEAAIARGAHYIDSTGEGAFIRDIFTEFGPRAEQAGVTMMTAMGYDYAPGHLAGAVALERGGADVVTVRIGYFNGGESSKESMSGGTAASSADAMFYPAHSFAGGRIVTEDTASRVHDFGEVDPGVPARAFSVGASEPFSLPRLYPQLRDVDVYLGWNDPDKVRGQVAKLAPLLRDEATRASMIEQNRQRLPGSTGGPDAATRAKSYAVILAEGSDSSGELRSQVRVHGANGYDFTADFMALAAEKVLSGEVRSRGAIGPVEAFGLDGMTQYAAQAGLTID